MKQWRLRENREAQSVTCTEFNTIVLIEFLFFFAFWIEQMLVLEQIYT